MDVLAAFLRKNGLIPCSEASNLADYFLTDRCSRGCLSIRFGKVRFLLDLESNCQ